ncbi:MAG TPA: DNA-binding protein [Phycisphaerales bacterium]|nr:DNA-binding protein [Phycisphaerales bacterium]
MAKRNAKSAPKKTAPRKPAKIEAAKDKPRSKSDTFATIAAHTELSRKQVAQVFDTLGALIAADLKTVKVFQVPGLMKVVRVDKPATKATKRPNPFKPGEMMTVKAKPARKSVKVRPLKGLKALVG